MDHFCGICAKPIVCPSLSVPCFGPCKKQFHHVCARFSNLSPDQIRYVVWLCYSCESGLGLSRSELVQQFRDLCRGGDELGTMADGPPLPTEMLEMIFDFLSFRDLTQVRLVCHRWKAVVDGCIYLMNEFMLKLPEGIEMNRDYAPDRLLPASAVELVKARIVTVEQWWPSLAEKLAEIILTECYVTLPELANMLQHSPNLLNIHFEDLDCPEFSDIATIANFQLLRLASASLFFVPPSVRDLLLEVGPHLKEFSYRSKNPTTNQSDTEKFMQYLSNKTVLDSIYLAPSKSLMDALINLKELQLTAIALNCNDISYEDISPIFQRQRNLQSVHLADIQLTNANICDIGQALPKLLGLDVELAVESDGNISFLHTMPNLETLTINDFPQVQNNGALANFKNCRIPKLKQIKLLAVQPSAWTDVNKFLKAAPNLTSVKLGTCKFNSWYELFKTLPMTKLKELSLQSITVPPKACPYAQLEYCVNLRHLELNLLSLSRETMQDLFRNCLRLEQISLDRIRTLNDGVMLVLCQHQNHLAKLSISKCPITDAAVAHIIDYCATLEQLEIENCPRITQAAQNRLEKCCKDESFRAIVSFKRRT